MLSHLNYGVLLHNAHTDPIVKNLNIAKLNDIFTLNQLKFYHKLVNKVPEYLNSLQLIENNSIHQHNTLARHIRTIRIKHSFANSA